MIAWLLSNWQGLAGIVGMILSVGVAIAHMAHADAVAQELSDIQADLEKLAGVAPVVPPAAPSA